MRSLLDWDTDQIYLKCQRVEFVAFGWNRKSEARRGPLRRTTRIATWFCFSIRVTGNFNVIHYVHRYVITLICTHSLSNLYCDTPLEGGGAKIRSGLSARVCENYRRRKHLNGSVRRLPQQRSRRGSFLTTSMVYERVDSPGSPAALCRELLTISPGDNNPTPAQPHPSFERRIPGKGRRTRRRYGGDRDFIALSPSLISLK